MSGPGAVGQEVGQHALVIGACLVLLVAGLAGGGQGGLGDLLAQELSLLLLGWMAWRWHRGRLAWRGERWVPWLAGAALALPLLQLLPIPEAVWAWGPGRGNLLEQLRSIGIEPATRITLDPLATERAMWSVLPACAMFLAVLLMPARGRSLLLFLVLALAVANVFLGMAQIDGGTQSPLRLYWPTNSDRAVGFFANRNHMAGMLAMSLPVVLVWTGAAVIRGLAGQRISVPGVIAGCVVTALLIAGIAITGSRAGLLLGAIAAFGALLLIVASWREKGAKRSLVIALGVLVMIVIQVALFGALQRMGLSSRDDGRVAYALNTAEAATAYLPLGSGLGTFRRVYEGFEDQPGRYIVNHAHNDYLELFLEGGLLALLLMSGFLFAWLRQGLSLWRRSRSSGDQGAAQSRLLALTAWLCASLALLHSALDYPLRTTASMTVFALFAAIAFSEGRSRHRGPGSRVPSASGQQSVPGRDEEGALVREQSL